MACQRVQALFWFFYRVKEDSIEIVRVLYGAQDIQNLLDRES